MLRRHARYQREDRDAARSEQRARHRHRPEASGSSRAYHHGDLKRALVESADRMIEEAGADDLSLRALAQATGVSRMAAYNHFDGKEALLAEIVRLGFEALEARLAEAPPGPESPRQALARAAAAYLDLARERPGRFRLMFARDRVDLARHPNAANAAARCYAALRRIVTLSVGEAAPGAAAVAAWSLVHGFASLQAELGAGFIDTAGAGVTPAYLAAALIDGVKMAAVFAPDPKAAA